ncbi:hypothetical protein HWV62_4281 [Athelia sp. TMB]|nr:hypothetical protein HWV62_4281 [Athelia sp. TMB]
MTPVLVHMLANPASDQALEKTVIAAFNKKLAAKIATFEFEHPGIKTYLWDSNAAFTTILDDLPKYGFVNNATAFGDTGDFWGNNYHPSSVAQTIFGKEIATFLKSTIWCTFNNVSGNQINHIAGDQHNYYGAQVENHPTHRPLSFNDAPTGLLSPHFSGRSSALKSVFECLEAPSKNGLRRCAVYGMPGLGKTQLAIRCAEIAHFEHKCALVFWMSAASVEKVHQGFSKILDLIDHPDRHKPAQSSILTAAQRWLEDSDAEEISWLLVVDNANQDTVKFLRQHLPRKNSLGAILFTTRTHAVASALVQAEQSQVLELKAPELGDAIEIFLKEIDAGRERDSTDYSDIQAVVKSFGCLPLAISHAASMAKQLHLDAKALLQLNQSADRFELINWENDLSDYEEKSVAATFARQLSELKIRHKDCSNLLQVIAFLDPEAISLQMLSDGGKEMLRPVATQTSMLDDPDELEDIPSSSNTTTLQKLKHKWGRQQRDGLLGSDDLMHRCADLDTLVALISGPLRLPSAVQKLQSLSLVAYESTTNGNVLHVHDLVRETIRGTMQKENLLPHWLDVAVELICGAFRDIPDHESPESWPKCEMLAPHIQAITAWDGERAFQNARFVLANIGMSSYLLSRGRFADAEVLSMRALTAMEILRGPDHFATVQAVHNVGTVYRLQGRYAESLPLLERALKGRLEKYGPENDVTLTTMQGLAGTYLFLARYAESEALLQRALEGKEKIHGPNTSDTLAVVNDLAIANALQGRYDAAEILFRRALTGYEKLSSAESVKCMLILDGLARVFRGQGRLPEAEEAHVRALAGKERLLGENHPDTLRSINNLAEIVLAREDYCEAERLCLKAMTGGELTLPYNHPTTLSAVKCLAAVYMAQDRDNEAEPYLRRAWSGDEKRFGSDHPETKHTLSLLVEALEKQGKIEEASALKSEQTQPLAG